MREVADTIRAKIGRPVAEEDDVFLHNYYRQLKARLDRGLLFGKRREDKYASDCHASLFPRRRCAAPAPLGARIYRPPGRLPLPRRGLRRGSAFALGRQSSAVAGTAITMRTEA